MALPTRYTQLIKTTIIHVGSKLVPLPTVYVARKDYRKTSVILRQLRSRQTRTSHQCLICSSSSFPPLLGSLSAIHLARFLVEAPVEGDSPKIVAISVAFNFIKFDCSATVRVTGQECLDSSASLSLGGSSCVFSLC